MVEVQSSLSDYFSVLRRRGWIVLAAALIAGGAAWVVSSRQPKVYEATSQVLLNQSSISTIALGGGGGNNSSDTQSRYDATQAQIAATPAVARLALTISGITGMSPSALLAKSSVVSDGTTNVLAISARNHSSAVAARLANGYANAYIRYQHTLNVAGLRSALANLVRQQKTAESQLNQAQAAGTPTASARQELQELSKRVTALQALLAVQTNTAVVSKLATGAQLIQPAPRRAVILGALLGIALGLALAFLWEALDTRLRTADAVGERLDLPMLVRLAAPSRKLRANKHLTMLTDPSGAGSEAYHRLRLNFDFANLAHHAKVVMITSAVEREGKTTTAGNLAVALAAAGRRTILLDLDLRRPTMGDYFGIDHRAVVGFSDVALGTGSIQDALIPVPLDGGECLHVMLGGPLPANPAEFFETGEAARVIDALKTQSDVVIVDSAPLLPVSDSQALGNLVDGIVVIARAETVRKNMMRDLALALQRCSAVKLGFVFAGSTSDERYGYGYGQRVEHAEAPKKAPARETAAPTAGLGPSTLDG